MNLTITPFFCQDLFGRKAQFKHLHQQFTSTVNIFELNPKFPKM